MSKTFLNQLLEYNIKPHDIEMLLSHFTTKKYKKDELIVREGQICNYLFYIEKGLAKLVTHNTEREYIMQFFDEGFLMKFF